MEPKIMEIAQRIRGMREILELSQEKMAELTETTLEEYVACEEGRQDFSFTFLHHCANAFGVDIVELLTGEPPKLSFYTVVRKGKGLPIRRNKNLNYEHLAYRLKNKLAEPFLVTAPYIEEQQDKPMRLSRHTGQEFDYVLSGSIKVQIEDHVEVLGPGDSIYYDSRFGHGLIATGGSDCTFIAIVIKDTDAQQEESK